MARAKNRGYQQSFSPSYTIRRWRLGIYIRLSKEDLKKGKDDSNSVKNQRDLLNDFYRRNIDEFESITEYVDDGHTGTDANREDFQRLLADVMSGKINCVIVIRCSWSSNLSECASSRLSARALTATIDSIVHESFVMFVFNLTIGVTIRRFVELLRIKAGSPAFHTGELLQFFFLFRYFL